MADEGGPDGAGQGEHRAPEQAAQGRRRQQHEVERPDVHERVDRGGDDEPGEQAETPAAAALDVAAPEDLLGRADPREQQRRDQPQLRLTPRAIDQSDLVEAKGRIAAAIL